MKSIWLIGFSFLAGLNGFAADLNGFLDARAGVRTSDDPHQESMTLGEARLQLELNHLGERVEFMLRADGVADAVDGDNLDLQTGDGPVDLRELWFLFSPTDNADVSTGKVTFL